MIFSCCQGKRIREMVWWGLLQGYICQFSHYSLGRWSWVSIWAPNVWAICKENGDFTHPISDSYSINCAPIKTASITTESNIKGVAKKSRRGFSLIANMIFVWGEIYLYQQKIDIKSFLERYITFLYTKNCRSKLIF